MKIKQAEFVTSCATWQQLPDDALPEIALAGRSNVGKSSLINRMLSRKQLARTSGVPGKTQTLNYYKINDVLYFVDFPGYGYAKVSKSERRKWGTLIEKYLLNRTSLKLLLLLIDIRHPPTKDDQAMFVWANHYDIPTVVVATKADKLSKSRVPVHVKQIRQTLEAPASLPIVPFSSETGAGRDELWEMIQAAATIGDAGN